MTTFFLIIKLTLHCSTTLQPRQLRAKPGADMLLIRKLSTMGIIGIITIAFTRTRRTRLYKLVTWVNRLLIHAAVHAMHRLFKQIVQILLFGNPIMNRAVAACSTAREIPRGVEISVSNETPWM